jgi:DNA-binding CsgD family transcriptional regulator
MVAVQTTAAGQVLATLSPRELEVLELAAQGLSNRQLAAGLRLSVHGVKFHLAGIYRKLGVTNRTEAASVYLRSPEALRRSV